jgi:iron complex outermembrane receptor protein
MAIGAEFYRDSADYKNNFGLIRQAASSGLELAQDSNGSRSWWGMFVEFNFPILKDLDLNIAGRYDDYSDSGSTFNPKVSMRWNPIKEVLIRGSYNEGFRAPSLYEKYSPKYLTFTENDYNDPVLCPGGQVNTAAGGVESRDCGIQFQNQFGGNEDLKSETSTAWSVGFVLQPIVNTTMSVDYWNYRVNNSINNTGETVIFGDPEKYANNFVRCSQLSPEDAAAIDACGIPGGDPLAYIVNYKVNLGTYKTSGIDFSAAWRSAATDIGTFSVGWQATYVMTYEYQLESGGPFYNNLGTYFNGQPITRYRQYLNMGWQYNDWTVNLINRYSGGYTDENADDQGNEVGAVNTWDLALTWSGIKGLVLTAGLTNMFNQEPPFSNQASGFQVGYDYRYGNPIGRAFLLRANYTF